MKIKLALLGVLALLASSFAGADGFLTRQGTELYMDGKPFRCVGVNKWNLFVEYAGLSSSDGATDEAKAHALGAIKLAKECGFNVMRFSAAGFYPSHMIHWRDESYFKAMDDLFDCARKEGVYLVPVIHWNPFLFPDMAKDDVVDFVTDQTSKGRMYLNYYTIQLADRYKDEKALLFWELTNELNLETDLMYMDERAWGWASINETAAGTAPIRVRRDHFTTDQASSFVKKWASLLKKHDPNHLISGGYSAPRPAAYNLWKNKGSWQEDTLEELCQYVKTMNPDPMDLVSVHYYSNVDNIRLGNEDPDSAVGLKGLKEAANRINKPIYIGETHPKDFNNPDDKFTANLINDAVNYDYSMILYWVWDIPSDGCNITPAARPELVEKMKQANKDIRKKAEK